MDTNNNQEPSSHFFDFDVYHFPDFIAQDDMAYQGQSIAVFIQDATADELTLLGKIFQALGKDLNKDVWIVNDSKIISYTTLSELKGLEYLLIFGIAPKVMGLNVAVQLYQPLSFQNYQILLAHRLAVIGADPNKKRQLWGPLQTMLKT